MVNRPVVSILIPAQTFTQIQTAAARAAVHGPGEADQHRASGAPGAPAGPGEVHAPGQAAGSVGLVEWAGLVEPGRPLAPATLEDGTPVALSQVAQAL